MQSDCRPSGLLTSGDTHAKGGEEGGEKRYRGTHAPNRTRGQTIGKGGPAPALDHVNSVRQGLVSAALSGTSKQYLPKQVLAQLQA